MEVFLLIAILLSGDGKPEGVKIIDTTTKYPRCQEKADWLMKDLKAKGTPIVVSCVPYKKPVEA